MIDVHAHLDDEKFEGKLAEVLENAKYNKVEKIICIGTDLQTCKNALKLAESYDNLYCALGLYPEYASQFDKEMEDFLLANANNKKVVAIGEIGLDYHMPPYDAEAQKKVFVRQLEIAHQFGLPVEIHSREATGDTIELLKQHKNLLTNGGIIHCFSGSLESCLEYQKLGLGVSLGGVITFKNAKNTLEMVKEIPLEMITIETDCPYLTPHPHRGELNQPAYTTITAQKIAETKGMTYGEIEKISTQNALRIFKKLA